MTQHDPQQRHRQRMARKKAVMDTRIGRAHQERGVLLLHMGNGKGKSSAAFGMVARALGHDMQIGIVQFIKGPQITGEASFFRRFPQVRYHGMGEGFTWETQDRERDTQAAAKAWSVAQELLKTVDIDLVVLDELNIALKYRYLELETVMADLRARPPRQHVVITGRGARPELIQMADTVTEMRAVKHAFDAGVRAQQGIEF